MHTNTDVTVAVVTGGHAYDVRNFHRLFRDLPGVDAFVQHMDDFASSPDEVRDSYDVLLFYIMLLDGPSDEGLPWYAGKPLTSLSRLGQTSQGIFVLHHGLLAYPGWPIWDAVVGAARRRDFGYYMNQHIRVKVAVADHPITAGLAAWEMVDETYTMTGPGPDSQILLATDHEPSMQQIAWTRQYGQSRVFCFQSGHDNLTWQDGTFREVLRRGILWCAGRTP